MKRLACGPLIDMVTMTSTIAWSGAHGRTPLRELELSYEVLPFNAANSDVMRPHILISKECRLMNFSACSLEFWDGVGRLDGVLLVFVRMPVKELASVIMCTL